MGTTWIAREEWRKKECWRNSGLPSRSSPSGSIPGRGGGGEGAQAGDVLVLGIQGAVEIGIEG
jgi:hypothetical protein